MPGATLYIAIVAASYALATLSPGLHAQDVGQLALAKVAELSSAAAPIAPSRAVSVGRLSTGHYVVTFRIASQQILKYDASGRLVKQYDRTGQGPGEFRRAPGVFIGRGDTIIATEQSRIVRFDSGLNPLSTHSAEIALRSTLIEFAPGMYAVTTPVATNGGASWMISILGSDGRVVKHLDLEQDRSTTERAVITSASSGFWSGRSNKSDLVLWSAQGEPLRHLRVNRSWFQPWDGEVTGEALTVKPRPRTVALRERRSGTLLMLTTVADTNWRPLGSPGQEIAIPLATMDWSTVFDTVVEIIDAQDGSVIAQVTVPQYLETVDGTSDLVFSTREDADGHVVIDIWRITMSETDTSRRW